MEAEATQGLAWAQQLRWPRTKATQGPAVSEYPTSLSATETKAEPLIWHVPSRPPTHLLGVYQLHQPLLSWKGQLLIVIGTETHSGPEFAFPDHSASVSTTSRDST